MINKDFWKDKKVFITGHTGFKGSWLSLWLDYLGANVTGYSLPPNTSPNLFEEADLIKCVNNIYGDIRDIELLTKSLKDCSPNIIIHMAAQPLVRHSYKNPVDTFSSNILGTVNIFEAARKANKDLKTIINVTTDKCYENKEWDWGYRENESMGGLDPYSCSKGCSELITNSYRHSFFSDLGVAIASARAGNVIGGGDWSEDRLIPDAIRSFEVTEKVKIRNPGAIRPWQHVLEPLSGYLLLAEHLYEEGNLFEGAWNFGPNDDDAISVKYMIDKLCKSWNYTHGWVIDKTDHPHEANYLKLDISKAKNNLKWFPKYSSNEAIEMVVEWHKARIDGMHVANLCIQQIKSYMEN